MPKKLKWNPLVSSGIVCYAETKEKLFWFSSLGQQVQFGVSLKFCKTFVRTILATSGVSKKTLTKSHDYTRLFSLEKRRLKMVEFCQFSKAFFNIFNSIFWQWSHLKATTNKFLSRADFWDFVFSRNTSSNVAQNAIFRDIEIRFSGKSFTQFLSN